MSQDLKINKGVELMLRRDKKKIEPKRKGLRVRQTISLFGKQIEFGFELTWGEH
jgi:hypothetical protein